MNRIAMAALAILTLVLAACGGDKKETSKPESQAMSLIKFRDTSLLGLDQDGALQIGPSKSDKPTPTPTPEVASTQKDGWLDKAADIVGGLMAPKGITPQEAIADRKEARRIIAADIHDTLTGEWELYDGNGTTATLVLHRYSDCTQELGQNLKLGNPFQRRVMKLTRDANGLPTMQVAQQLTGGKMVTGYVYAQTLPQATARQRRSSLAPLPKGWIQAQKERVLPDGDQFGSANQPISVIQPGTSSSHQFDDPPPPRAEDAPPSDSFTAEVLRPLEFEPPEVLMEGNGFDAIH